MTDKLNNILADKAHKIKWFFTDVDGTLTDGSVYYSSAGEELKKFSLRDGSGFFLLKLCNINSGIITTENSPIVAARAQKLNVSKYIFGVEHKVSALSHFIQEIGVEFDEVAYIGDEINDLNLLMKCGLSFAVSDANTIVKSAVDIVCTKKGGDGAVKEAIEHLLHLKGYDIASIVANYF